MNKKLLFLLPLLGAMSLAGCEKKDDKPSEEQPHTHVDANNDHKCDTCGETVSEHVDANHDHKCDVCAANLSEHVDANHDHKCDVCGATISQHVDANNDHKCDTCGATISEHVDANNDHKCDTCGATISEHVDENHDHKCDVCDVVLSQHTDANGDFKCDYCNVDLETTKVELDTTGVKTVYAFGEEFSTEGLKVIATSSVGSTRELEFEAVAPDMSTGGEKTVVVTYGEGEDDKKEYKITVTYWKASDLEVFEEGSFTSLAPLPYYEDLGLHTVAEWEGEGEEKELVSWKIVGENVSSQGYLKYLAALRNFNKVVSLPYDETTNIDVTFKLDELDFKEEYIEEYYPGLTDVSVFVLIPSYVDSDGYDERAFINDEYFVLGIDEEGSLVLENRMVNAVIDGMFFGNEFADGEYYFPAAVNYYIANVGEILSYYYSEFSSMCFAYPPLDGAGWDVVPYSLFSLDPLNKSLDEYDAAWAIEIPKATASDYESLCTALAELGFVVTPSEEDPNKATAHFADNESGSYLRKYAGEIEYEITFYPEVAPDPEVEGDKGKPSDLVYEFYYKAPEHYTTHLSPACDNILAYLAENIESLDSENAGSLTTPSIFLNYGNEVYGFEMESLVPTQEQAAKNIYPEMLTADHIASVFEPIGFTVLDEAYETSYSGEYYAVSYIRSEYYNIEIDVFEPNEETGVCSVQLWISEYINPEDVVRMVFGSVIEPLESGYYVAGFEDEDASVKDAQETLEELAASFESFGMTVDGVRLASETTLVLSGTMNFEEYAFTLAVIVEDGVSYQFVLDFSLISELESNARYVSYVLNESCIRGLDYVADASGGFDVYSIFDATTEEVEDVVGYLDLLLSFSLGMTSGEVVVTEDGASLICYSSDFDISISAYYSSEAEGVIVESNVHAHEVSVTDHIPNGVVEAFFAESEIAVTLVDFAAAGEDVEFVTDATPLVGGGIAIKVVNATKEEMEAYIDSMKESGWVLLEDKYGDSEGTFGETSAAVYIADYTDPQYLADGEEPFILVNFYIDPTLKDFPTDVLTAFFAAQEVVVEVPEFEGSEEVTYVIDDSYASWGYLNVYADNATREEMLAYVEAVDALDGWTATEDESGDYELKHESGAVIYVYDYTNPEYLEEGEDPYISFAFYVEVAEEAEAE